MKTKLLILSFLLITGMMWGQKPRYTGGISGQIEGNHSFTVEAFTEFDNRTKYQRTDFLVTNESSDEVEVQIETAITYTCGRVENGYLALTGGQTLRLKSGEAKKTGTWLKETMDEKCITIGTDGVKSTIVGITYSGVVLKNNSAKSNPQKEKNSTVTDNTSQSKQNQINIPQNQPNSSTNKQAQAQQQANDIIAKIQREQQERERQSEIQAQQITEAATELVQLGTAMFEGIAADRENERKREAERKSRLEKSLSPQFEKATQGDDQSYYDIFKSYKDSGFKQDANRFKDLAYSTGNFSVFENVKAEEKRIRQLERISPRGNYLGFQSGEISRFGFMFLETTENFGFYMSFRIALRKTDGDPLGENDIKNRGVFTDDRGNTYTFLSEASKKEQGRMLISLGTSYNIYNPFFIYTGIGFGTVSTFSMQQKIDTYNRTSIEKMDESFLGFSTDIGLIVKLGRTFAINGGVGLMNFKYPEYVFGLNINLVPMQ